MKIQHIFLIIATLLLIVSCSSEDLIEIEPVKEAPFDTPFEEIQEETVVEEPEQVEETTEIIEPEQSSQVKQLIDKNSDLDNIYFKHVAIVTNEGGSEISEESYIAHIAANRIKKEYNTGHRFGADYFYNDVYLNTETQEAIGACSRYGVSCQEIYETAKTVDFESNEIHITPLTILHGISADAVFVTDENIGSRKANVIEFINQDGHTERISIDAFYELPIQRIIYEVDGDVRTQLRKDSFPKLRVGGVTELDVTVPAEFNFTG